MNFLHTAFENRVMQVINPGQSEKHCNMEEESKSCRKSQNISQREEGGWAVQDTLSESVIAMLIIDFIQLHW